MICMKINIRWLSFVSDISPWISSKEVEEVKKSDCPPGKKTKEGKGWARCAPHFLKSSALHPTHCKIFPKGKFPCLSNNHIVSICKTTLCCPMSKSAQLITRSNVLPTNRLSIAAVTVESALVSGEGGVRSSSSSYGLWFMGLTFLFELFTGVSSCHPALHNVHFVKYDGPVVKSWNRKIHFLMGKKYFWGYFSYVVLGRKL